MRITQVLSLNLLAFFCLVCVAQAQEKPDSFWTVPEWTSYERTSTYSEVMDFIIRLKEKADFHVFSMGKSKEGKDIPVVALANPPISSAEESMRSGKPVMYVQGNIHAGEVEGKEVLLMLMRDILLGEKKYLLDNQIILFAPIYNTDSNDKMEVGRRPSQENSPQEVGIRENSQGWDLNRDGMKMDAFETAGLFTEVINKWDPQLFVDLHTTNGTWHGYSLTWAPSYHTCGALGPFQYTYHNILPTVTQKVQEKHDLHLGPYGYYFLKEGWPPKSVYTYNHHPRYLVNQFGLRNRMAILSESFAHEKFYQRIHSTYAFVLEILNFTNANAQEIIIVNQEAEKMSMESVRKGAGTFKKGVQFKMVPFTKKLDGYRTYDYQLKKDSASEYLRMPNIVAYDDVTYFARFEPLEESVLPRGYLISKDFPQVIENLRMHGVQVEQLTGPVSAEGEFFLAKELKNAGRVFEGHHMTEIKGEFRPGAKTFTEGDFKIDLNQPLANLIFYLLEPRSDDGLVTWNFFDEYFEEQNINRYPVAYPVFKYLELVEE